MINATAYQKQAGHDEEETAAEQGEDAGHEQKIANWNLNQDRYSHLTYFLRMIISAGGP
jgi:hypothetical protein